MRKMRLVVRARLRAFRRAATEVGYTVLELTFAVSLAMVIGAAAVPRLLTSADEIRAAGAARYVATRLHGARLAAVARSAAVGWQFVGSPTGGYTFAPYQDGNGNGIRSRDIQDGIDPQVGPVERLSNQFPGVEFGALPGLPPIDPGGSPPGSDPIRLGTGSILTFTPTGTATAGTLYVLGRNRAQYAVRVLGETGRTRVLRFNPTTGQWGPA